MKSLAKRFLYITFCVVSISQIYAQQKLLSKADDSFEHFEYIDAQKIYLEVAKKGYTSAGLYKKLGDSYYFNSKLKEALPWFDKLFNEYPEDLEPKYLFRYAQSLKSVQKYEEADIIMDQFHGLTGNMNLKPSAMSSLDYMKFVQNSQSGRFTIVTLDINSKESDYAPKFYKDQLVFASSRIGSGSGAIHEWNDMPFSDLYIVTPSLMLSEKNKNPKKLKGKVNSKYHEASVCFTKDGNTMYFTRNNFIKNKLNKDEKGTISLKLYKATLKKGKWEDITELPFNSDSYSVAHPALSADEKTLYFASDMPGTYGLSDIYKVDILENNQYGTPQNLGETINTQGRETFPFISQNGNLYFASDGHLGFGGLDIFVAEHDEFGYVLPFNVGEPINSPVDDFGFIIDDTIGEGYFASNRERGTGSDDIYGFIQLENLITSCKQYIEGVIADEETLEPIYNAKVILINNLTGEHLDFYTDYQGFYKVPIECDGNYRIQVFKEEYAAQEFYIRSSSKLEQKYNKPIQLKKGYGMRSMVGIGMDLATILKLDPIYFDTNKATIRKDAEVELQQIIAALQLNPHYRINVRSHTDSRAKDSYNLALSKKRAQATVKYIIEKGGIDSTRVTGKGYGETQLINNCKNGVPCDEQQHQLNRRSEFIIDRGLTLN